MTEIVMGEVRWIGVDLDETLAEFDMEEYRANGSESIGNPIPRMAQRVINWHLEGKRVKIFTARVSKITARDLGTTVEKMEQSIHNWLFLNFGFDLEVTNEKDYAMIELWDNIRLIEVENNTGKTITDNFQK